MRLSVLFGLVILSLNASAMSVDWSGVYRFELVNVDRPSLDTGSRKSYGLNYLGLKPRIIASDGIEIAGQFDVLSAGGVYKNSQLGQIWGSQHVGAAPEGTDVTSETQEASTLLVRQLYLNVNQEYGSLLVGRAPFGFGLGITYDAGNGPFDHWATTRDMVAYKFIVGNMFLMPMISRISQADPAAANIVQEQAVQAQYESEESGSMIGVMLAQRKSSSNNLSNDIDPTLLVDAPATAAQVDQYSMQTTSFVIGRKWDSFRFRMEGSFQTGDYGVQRTVTGPPASTEFIRQNGYGVAIEMEFPRPESKWDYALRLGAASGDDPETADIESFIFHRNYDIAMLMFNHRLGQFDILRTKRSRPSGLGIDTSLDDEAITNAMYFSPKIRYAWNDRWDIDSSLTLAQLMTKSTTQVDFKKDLGVELDMSLVYKPRTNVRWVNELGLLFPGAAFKDGATDYTSGFTFGFATKAAITF